MKTFPKMMKAAYMERPGKLDIIEMPVPEISETEVLIEVKACGICGTDILALHGEHPRVTYPRVLGHEFAGEVVKTGAAVTNIKVGDRVTEEMMIACGKCWACRQGITNHCIGKMGYIGLSVDGAFAQYVKIPEKNCIKLPDSFTWIEGALAETLGVAYNAVRLKGNVGAGQTVAIIGCGAVGMNVLMCAKVCGAFVIVSDTVPKRLEIAKKIGADVVLDAKKDNIGDVARQLTGGAGADIVFETVGGNNSGTVRTAVETVRACGKVVVMGTNSKNSAEFPVTVFKEKEITMMGSRGIPYDCVPRAMDMAVHCGIDQTAIVTGTFALDELKHVFELFEKDKENTLKMVIDRFD